MNLQGWPMRAKLAAATQKPFCNAKWQTFIFPLRWNGSINIKELSVQGDQIVV